MGATTYPYADAPLDPQHDPIPVTNWLSEVGPSLIEAIKAMLGFAAGVV